MSVLVWIAANRSRSFTLGSRRANTIVATYPATSAAQTNTAYIPSYWSPRVQNRTPARTVSPASIARRNSMKYDMRRTRAARSCRFRRSATLDTYLMLPATSKIGMYIAISMPPTRPPRPTTISGPSRAVIAPTATSTSSS